ncbi:alpha-catulin isoform X1 [Anastrepha ludens]|uniref:alpha-catulin isoform X1 n=1 Tax=Anastrepha ludens TaxID=28586 RepID=UPI0023B199DC|nr:alpha-catulin isoform X1 [Anastrepha ludens]
MSSYECERRVATEKHQPIVGATDRRVKVISHVGHAVNLAIERFVTIGEIIAEDNLDIKSDILECCRNARDAGKSIERLCDISAMDNMNYSTLDLPVYDENAIIIAAKALISAVTRILLLVDIVVVKQLLTAKRKIVKSLRKLESVVNFTEFVRAYSLFGIEMIELAYLIRNQQNNIKEERRRAQMFSAKQILEHSISILLSSSKASLLHYDCMLAKENRDTVFCQIRRAMDLIHFVVKDCIFESAFLAFNEHGTKNINGETVQSATNYLTFLLEKFRTKPLDDIKPTMYIANNNYSKIATSTTTTEKKWNNEYSKRRNSFGSEDENLLIGNNYKQCGTKISPFSDRDLMTPFNIELIEELIYAFEKLLEKTHDFTDSAYTSHENREHILFLCDRCKLELKKCLNILYKTERNTRHIMDEEIDRVISISKNLTQQLILSVADQTADLYHSLKTSVELVNSFHLLALNEDPTSFQEWSNKFHDCCDHIIDVCKLLQHIAFTESLQVQSKCLAINLRIYGPQVILAAKILSRYPSSVPANENMDAFAEMWKWLISEITNVAQQILDTTGEQCDNKTSKKYKTTARPLSVGQEEPGKVSAADTKEIPSEIAPFNEKWNDEVNDNNDIIKRAKNMSAMAFAMYQFTKGNGTLRTTQDLFTQAEYFAEEANRLYKVLRQFSYQVPASQNKKDLLNILDRVPTFVQTLQFTVKDHTVGKDATFVKVDHVIRETKNLMSVINKVVTKCFECATKYKLDLSGLSGGLSSAGALGGDDNNAGGMGDSKGTTSSSEGSM